MIRNVTYTSEMIPRRGTWEYDTDGIPVCSLCENVALQRMFLSGAKTYTYTAKFMLTKYCPNCGAKLEEDEYAD